MKVLLSGVPGKMQQEIAAGLTAQGLDFCDFALSSPARSGSTIEVAGREIRLFSVEAAQSQKLDFAEILAVDYSKPTAALGNVKFFCENNIPFVMGTSGFDREKAIGMVRSSKISAVIAPNMAGAMVMLQAMLEFAAENFSGALDGFRLKIVESHQASKVDKSGTALAFSKELQKLGAGLISEDFQSIRDPQAQRAMGIPETALTGHAYHTYEIQAPDGSHEIGFSHNVRGRAVYVTGTIQAIQFLEKQSRSGSKGQVFSMRDVLKSGVK